MGRIHRYGQRFDCLIFNFVATNTIEGRVLQRLLDKLQEIRDALDDDAVFNVIGEVLPAAQVERVFRDFYAGNLGEADLEDRLLRDVDERRFRDICQTALEGLATKKLNLAMLVERRARAQERRVVPETIARFMAESAERATLALSPVAGFATYIRAGTNSSCPEKIRARVRLEPFSAGCTLPSPLYGPHDGGRNGTWSGSHPGIRFSRPCAGTAWSLGVMCSPQEPVFILLSTTSLPDSISIGPG